MLCWARTWRLPQRGLGLSRTSFSTVPVAHSSSSSGQGGADPRPVRLSYKLLDGDAVRPALVFLHGLLGSKNNFNSVAKALAQHTGRRVLTVDARNHGDSFHSPDMSYEAMSQDLQDFLPQLGLVPCVLIGHSMGGKTAMLLALQRPELVERLIVEDMSPVEFTSDPNIHTYIAAMRAIDIPDKVPLSHARKLADEQLSRVVQVMPPSPQVHVGTCQSKSGGPRPHRKLSKQDINMRKLMLTNLVEADGRLVWRLNLDTVAKHLDKILAFPPQQEPFPGPTLFLCGEHSKYVHPSHYPEIRRLFPQAQMQTVPNSGHWIHASHPQEFMAAIRDFLV